MRRLMLLRHAKTERAEPGQRDRDRKLTKRGRDDAPVIGAYMARHGLTPTWRWCRRPSAPRKPGRWWRRPLPRRRGSSTKSASTTPRPRRLFKIISETRGAHSLLVVGHNPGLHDVAMQLIASGDVDARERVAEKLPTAGLVVIDLAFDDWSRLHRHAGRLERFVTPRLIAAATD